MPNRAFELAIHSTHEAAHKIAGIGAVLDGFLPTEDYQAAFARTLLVGPYAFNSRSEAIFEGEDWRVSFDSLGALCRPNEGPLSEPTRQALARLSREAFHCRVVVGQRRIQGTWVDVVLASPDGVAMRPIRRFEGEVEHHFGVNIRDFASWPAVRQGENRILERVLRNDRHINSTPDEPITDALHRELPGGVAVIDERAQFPALTSLDAFQGFARANPYLIELQFYLYSAPPLWAATCALMQEWGVSGEGAALFAHDWLGVPLFWASQFEDDEGGFAHQPRRTIYFAHEARYARLLVEGVLWDQRGALDDTCHPDGHDVSFYAHLAAQPSYATLEGAFPGVTLDRIPYHLLNTQARRFDRILAVGDKVLKETRLLTGEHSHLRLCPNGVPAFSEGDWGEVEAAGARLRDFAEVNLGFRPDQIFTSVSRCELSKAPWRNVALFEAYAKQALAEDPNASGLLVWLLRPRPTPTPEEVEARARRYGWPKHHQLIDEGGDLRRDEWLLWTQIEAFNQRWAARNFHILYINQFGWDAQKLGALDPAETRFADLRLGTDVELALSIYEPFGISALEPFSSGAVCVISDACGCAGHLKALSSGLHPKITPSGFLIAPFTQHHVPPQQVDLEVRAEIEARVYAEIAEALHQRLREGARGRQKRLRAATAAMPHLSWESVVRDYLLPSVTSP